MVTQTALLLLLVLIHANGWMARAEPVLRIPRVASPPQIDEFAAGSLDETESVAQLHLQCYHFADRPDLRGADEDASERQTRSVLLDER